MRTKALLLGAIIGAASLASSMAQVYSVNIVGYINVQVPPGFCMLANQLNNSAGNSLETLIPAPTTAISVYKYDAATGNFNIANWDSEFNFWDNTFTLGPGEGFWVYNPGALWTLTLVGEVKTGQQSVPLLNGFNLVSAVVPQQLNLADPATGYVPSVGGESIFTFDNASGNFNISNYDSEFKIWDLDPVVKVGEGFWIQRTEPGSWTRTFNVSGN